MSSMHIQIHKLHVGTMSNNSSIVIGGHKHDVIGSSNSSSTQDQDSKLVTQSKTTDARVTVVIPTYNRAKQLTRAVQSVMNQTYKKWHLLIVDDGSSDRTMDYVKNLVKNDKRITYYRLPQNMGLSHAMNKALNMIESEYMVQLDSDDWLEKDAIHHLIEAMDRNARAALAYGNHTIWHSPNNKQTVKLRSFTPADKYDLLVYGPSLYPRFYRTSALRSVGGWSVDDKYNGRIMEDRTMMLKIIEKYSFTWADRNLYNLTRDCLPRATSPGTREKYAEVKKELVTKTIKRWGDHYIPQFSVLSNGWIKTTLIPKR